MAESSDFKSIQDKISTSLVKATRVSNAIGAEDISFQRSANPATSDKLDGLDERLRSVTGDLIEGSTKDDNKSIKGLLPLEDADDIDYKWSRIVDAIDSVLEKADTAMDEYSGLIKRKDAPTAAAEASALAKKPKQPSMLDRNLRFANVTKPQLRFEKKVDNLDKAPWKPILTSKPHAKYPLEESLILDEDKKTGLKQYRHPYENEIVQWEPPAKIFKIAEPINYQPVESTKAKWVDTYEGVLEMLEELKKADVIAVDLEHHDLRTFTGLTSLMQISTRQKDWIVDTLQPWRHKLEILNEVFADPHKVKVLHGAQSDIIWLQRDLGLYIVGLFDTYFACDALNHPSRGLAGLLKRYVDFDADKKYQMADWRVRPIPEEMLYYARSDTHYLLYIFDHVRNDLITTTGGVGSPVHKDLSWVLAESKKVALQRHEGYPYDAKTGHGARGWFNPISRGNVFFDGESFAIYRAVHQWRDNLARQEDENPSYLISQKDLMQIAKIKPPDRKALTSLLGPNRQVRAANEELFELIQGAKAQGANEPSLSSYLSSLYGDKAAAHKPAVPASGVNSRGVDGEGLLEVSSQLFGKMKVSSLYESKKPENPRPMPLPWTSEMQAASSTAQPITPLAERPKLEEAPEIIDVSDEEFTVKKGRGHKISGKGRAKDVADTDMMMIDAASSDEEDDEAASAKKLEKKKRKEERRLKREAKKAKELARENDDDEVDEEAAAFDYATAESVLHARKNNANGTSSSGKKFDPYAIGDGPKAARRMHHEKTGKTATFKK